MLRCLGAYKPVSLEFHWLASLRKTALQWLFHPPECCLLKLTAPPRSCPQSPSVACRAPAEGRDHRHEDRQYTYTSIPPCQLYTQYVRRCSNVPVYTPLCIENSCFQFIPFRMSPLLIVGCRLKDKLVLLFFQLRSLPCHHYAKKLVLEPIHCDHEVEQGYLVEGGTEVREERGRRGEMVE